MMPKDIFEPFIQRKRVVEVVETENELLFIDRTAEEACKKLAAYVGMIAVASIVMELVKKCWGDELR